MAPKSQNNEYPCVICQEKIKINDDNLLKGTTHYKCFECKKFVHKGCAEEKKLLAVTGFYYCEEHKNRAPKSSKRTNNTDDERNTPRGFDNEKTNTSELSSSESEESDIIDCTMFNQTELNKEEHDLPPRDTTDGNTNQMILNMLVKMQKDIKKLKARESAHHHKYNRKSGVWNEPGTSQNTQKEAKFDSEHAKNEKFIGDRSLNDILSSSVKTMNKEANSTKNDSDVDSIGRQLMEMQMLETKRSINRSLPVIKSISYEWKIFYRSFLDSESLFSKTENVRRLQDAIQCEEIKKIGGMCLFSQETYLDALKVIDKKIGRSEILLLDEKNKLIKQEPLRSNNIVETISFIEKIKNYSNLVSTLGNLADKTDSALIAHISRTLPYDLKNKWRVQYRKIYDEFGTVYLSQLSKWLDSAISDYETDLLFERMDPYKQESSKFSNKNQRFGKNFKQKENKKFFYNATDDVENDNTKKTNFSKIKSPNNYCWHHNKKGHSSLHCYTLLAKSGKEVSNLAKAKGICTICARETHNPCPQKDKFPKCIIPECNIKHAAIFCFLRKSSQPNQEVKSQNEAKRSFYEKDSSKPSSSQQNKNSNENNGESKNDELSASANNFNACHGFNTDSYYNSWTVREIPFNNYRVNNNAQEKNQIKSSEKYTASTLLPIVVIDLSYQNKNMRCAIMLDTGSEVSLLDEKFASFLKAPSINRPLSLQWSGGKTRTDLKSGLIKIKAKGVHRNAKSYDIYFRTIKDLGIPDQSFNAKEMKEKFQHLKNLPLESYTKIVGILGQDQNQFLKQLKWIEHKNSEKEAPVVILTQLGYAVMGHSCPLEKLYKHLSHVNLNCSMSHKIDKMFLPEGEEEELIKMQDSAMGLEFMLPYENDRKVADDEEALAILKHEVKKCKNKNKYEAPLLWREKNIKLPTEESLKVALRRLRILISHANRIGKFNEIKGQIENLITKNYARVLNEEESRYYTDKTFYLPIFITDPNAKRIRLIWDAAAKINGKSLNDYLLCGPNLYADLVSILMKAREGIYFVKGDIQEMFHQIEVKEEDRKALRFLFIDDEFKIKHYEMKVLIFGAVCAPTISQYVKNLIAEENKSINLDAAESLIKDPYVDDYIISFNNLKYGQKMIQDVRIILMKGGMNLVKLKGNNESILDEVRKNLTVADKENEKLFSCEKNEKILGYLVDFEIDCIQLNFPTEKFDKELMNGTKAPTKKEILKFLMSHFDPLGLFTFLTSKIKLLYRWTCKEKLDWKEVIGNHLMPYWKQCLKWLHECKNVRVPRCYGLKITEATRKQLIIFGDAGKEMLCTVAYIRLVDKNNIQLRTTLIAAKSYAVPIKQKRSIPELELDVAAKAVQLNKLITSSHSIKFDENIYATDNACVYHWITNGPQKPSQYVKNRFTKISTETKKNEWIWIPTEWQPADYGTKFDSMPQIKYENNWFLPPIFSLPEENWYQLKPPSDVMQKSLNIFISSKKQEINDFNAGCLDMRKFSSWDKFIRVTQIILKWKYLAAKKVRRMREEIEKTLNVAERETLQKQLKEYLSKTKNKDFLHEEAEIAVIRATQRHCFAKEIAILKSCHKLPKDHLLNKICPFIDEEDGLLRSKTRLPNISNFDKDRINPIILPKNHETTTRIIMKYHENNKHVHENTVVANLLQRFYIPNIRWTVKKTIRRNCMRCKRSHAKPDQPQMGDLPSYRLATHQPAFTFICIDVCGPFEVKRNRVHEKRWILVSTCLTTRAVHMEVLFSMNTQSCLKALQNTICLRGAPTRIISDCGSNFIGCDNILQDVQERWNRELLEKGVITQKIEWEFNPAKASHMSGSVERLIGLIKQVLKNLHNTLSTKLIFPDDETLRCIVCEIIGMLNNRPLTMVPMEGNEHSLLTPNHFLMLRGNFQSTPNNNKVGCQIKNWIEVKNLINSLWDHFHKAYINEIKYKDKWLDYCTPLKIGDIVVVADPTVSNLWRLAVVTKTEKGSNDQVRKLTLRLGKRNEIKKNISIKSAYNEEKFVEITRPATQVAPLNLVSKAIANIA